MKPVGPLLLRLLHSVLIVFFCSAPRLNAGSPPDHSWDPNRATNPPYGLVDLDHLSPGDYGYCRWGVMMASGCATGLPYDVLSFTPLTIFQSNPMYGSGGPLFLDVCGTNTVIPIEAIGSVGQLDASNRWITIPPGIHYSLFRKYHYPLSLLNVSGGAMNGSTRKAIVLLHGWNPASDNDSYDEPSDDKEFYQLRENLKSATQTSGWQVFTYHWESDADTGPMPPNLDAAINGSEAAEAGHLHGQHLGELVDRLTDQKIEKVHFVVHSAGSWAARSATKYLLSARANSPEAPPIKIQITFLDPFVPGDLFFSDGTRDSQLTRNLMNGIPTFHGANANSLYRLENYYAADLAFGTNREFAWRSPLIDQPGLRIDTGFNSGEYDDHAGPVLFYSDTVDAGDGSPSPAAFARLAFGFDLRTDGWGSSLFYNEPIVNAVHPADVTTLATGGKSLTGSAHLRGDTANTTGITYSWEWTATPQSESSWTIWNNLPFGSSPELTLSASDVNAMTRSFRLVARTAAGYDTGDPIPVSPTVTPGGTAPTAPTNLAATAVSSSQINLTWHDASTNENGFNLQRRLTSGATWTDLPNTSANSQAFSNTASLSPGTTYSYRIRSYNSSGASAWSAEASATTLAAPGSTFTLLITATDGTQPVITNVSSWTGSGGNYLYQALPALRSFVSGSSVTVNLPLTSVGGKIFQYWLLDGATRHYSTMATVQMNAAHSFTAVFGTTPPPARTVSSISVEGPSSVDEEDSASYQARATFSDGSNAIVTGVTWDENSSYASISSAGVLDAESVTSDKSVTVTATYTSGGVTRSGTKSITIRNATAAATYTLTRNVVGSGEIGYSPQANSYADGTWVSLHANADDGYVFDHWSGDASGTDDDIYIIMDQNQSVAAHFVPDPSIGNLRVDISPAQAVAEGAAWRYDLFTAWRPSGDVQSGISPRTKYLEFKDIPGWITPARVKASIIGGQTTVISGAAATYKEILGSVQVTITPAQAVAAGARWRLDGGAWTESGVALSDVATGNHTVDFSAGGGWSAATTRTVNVQRGLSSVVEVPFDPLPGLPVISSLRPSSGGLDGGYSVEIEGANFGPSTIVTFGGVAATAVTVLSPTRLNVTVPPGARYGSVSVAATSGGQTGTKVNGFSYSIPLAQNMTLLSQIGGTVGAVAAAGSMVYFGEGSSIVSADYTNPSAPIVRGRLPLPGMVRDIRIVGNHALIANRDFGLQIVDVSDPINLRLVGYYDTPGSAVRLGVMGNTAYVADSSGGLQVIDFSDRTNPHRVGMFPVTSASDVGVTQIGSKVIVCLAAQGPNGILVLDVSAPANIQQLSVVEGSISQYSLALNGSTLVCHGEVVPGSTVGKIYSLSVPATPTRTHEGTFFQRIDVGIVNAGFLYSGTDEIGIWDLNVAPDPPRKSNTALPGRTKGMARSGNLLYIARGSGGLVALDVSVSVSPITRSTLNSNFVPTDIALSGEKAHTAIANGLTAIDVADPRHPQRQGTAISANTAYEIILSGNTVYAAAWRRFDAFSIINPAAPTLASTIQPGPEAYSIGYVNGHLAVGGQVGAGSDRALLLLYTPSGFQTGTPASTLELTTGWGLTSALAVHGNTVFALLEDVGLKCIDYSVPRAPNLLGSATLSGVPTSAAVSADGRFVYVANLGGGLAVFDCADLFQPASFASYVRNGQTSGTAVALSGNLVFYGDGSGVNVLDCTDPAHLTLVASYDTPGQVNAIRVAGNIIYVADGEGGLEILELGDISQPLIQITGPTVNGTFETTSTILELSGSGSDTTGVVRVTWENDRGGGGVATGTNAWTIPNIQLAAGVNVITVTAEDANGNLAHDSITVTATLPETDGPALLITGPQPPPAFTFTDATLPLTGTAADVSGVQAVTWANDRGGSGTATGTTAWSANIPLFPGPNGITITARDTPGNQSQTTLVVTYLPPDTVAPVVQVTFPVAAQEYATSDAILNLAGTADDAGGLARIRWANSRGGQGDATGNQNWQANGLLLQSGLNILTITAEDLTGNTATDTLAVMFTPGDSDQDGLLDAWELLYFGTLTNDADSDPDSDGQSTTTEYATGTNPASGASRFAATVHLDSFTGKPILTWASLPTRIYTVQEAPTPGGPWTTAITVPANPAPAIVTSWTAPSPPAPGTRKFFRVRLE